MATDFAPYANFRLLWAPPGTVASFRSGTPAAGTPIVIEAFLKGETGTPIELPSVGAAPRILNGYITAYAALPAQADWLAAGSAFSWTDQKILNIFLYGSCLINLFVLHTTAL